MDARSFRGISCKRSASMRWTIIQYKILYKKYYFPNFKFRKYYIISMKGATIIICLRKHSSGTIIMYLMQYLPIQKFGRIPRSSAPSTNRFRVNYLYLMKIDFTCVQSKPHLTLYVSKFRNTVYSNLETNVKVLNYATI